MNQWKSYGLMNYYATADKDNIGKREKLRVEFSSVTKLNRQKENEWVNMVIFA